jgi:hypothetical protein
MPHFFVHCSALCDLYTAGELGIPLRPTPTFPDSRTDACAFFSVHALRMGVDALVPALENYLRGAANGSVTAMLTDGLLDKLHTLAPLFNASDPRFNASGAVHVLPVAGSPQSLLEMPSAQLEPLRRAMLSALSWSMDGAPPRIALFPWADGSYVIENFGNESVTVDVSRVRDSQQLPLRIDKVEVPPRGWVHRWASGADTSEK